MDTSVTIVTIRIDYENNASRWWTEARLRRAEAPESCRPLLFPMFREDTVMVSSEEAEAFRTWAAKIPGWEEGPAHAPRPFTFHENVSR